MRQNGGSVHTALGTNRRTVDIAGLISYIHWILCNWIFESIIINRVKDLLKISSCRERYQILLFLVMFVSTLLKLSADLIFRWWKWGVTSIAKFVLSNSGLNADQMTHFYTRLPKIEQNLRTVSANLQLFC